MLAWLMLRAWLRSCCWLMGSYIVDDALVASLQWPHVAWPLALFGELLLALLCDTGASTGMRAGFAYQLVPKFR